MKAKLNNVTRDFKTGNPIISFEILDNLTEIEYKKEDLLELEFKKYRKARSNNANSYCWYLCTELAKKLKITKEEVYTSYIRLSNMHRDVEINKEASDTLVHTWGLNGTGWIAEKLDNGKLEGFEIIRLYYGSSTYNTKQMANMLELIVQDCKEQSIPVKEDREIEEMLKQWQKK